MRLEINGRECEVEECDCVGALLEKLALTPERVAVLVNEAVVPGAARRTHPLREQDRVEIVTFLAGG
jgi:thiamine biosynthesis protein ThiS